MNDRTAYVNGEFLPLESAKVPLMDRGFLFGDGVYEVSAVIGGRLVDNDAHLSRLQRSLQEIDLELPMGQEEIVSLQKELIARDSVQEGIIYLQVTRGPAERDFAFPAASVPTLVMFTQAREILVNANVKRGVKVVSTPDLRWFRRDIKSICLLPQVLAKQHAVGAGGFEAILIKDGHVTEAASSSVFHVSKEGVLRTRPLSSDILAGVTRAAILRLAGKIGTPVEQQASSLAELLDAREVFLTSAAMIVMPVIAIDGKQIGDGKPGPCASMLREQYLAEAVAS